MKTFSTKPSPTAALKAVTSRTSMALVLDAWVKEEEIHDGIDADDGVWELDADAVDAEDKDADKIEVPAGGRS